MKATKQFLLICALSCLGALQIAAQNTLPTRVPSADLDIMLGRQELNFIPRQPQTQLRLQIHNQLGELLFDSGANAIGELRWNLKDHNGTSLKGGLYRYTLTLKGVAAETETTQRGNLIVEQDGQHLWLTTQDNANLGADANSGELTVAHGGDRTVAGLNTATEGRATRDLAGREIVTEAKDKNTPIEKTPIPQELYSVLGTANRVVKFGAGGLADTDTGIREDASGRLGFNVNSSATTPYVFNGDIVSLGAGLPAFILQSEADHARLEMRSAGTGAPIVQGRSASGTLGAPGATPLNQIMGGFGGSGYDTTNGYAPTSSGFIGINAAENWTSTAHGSYITFGTTPTGSLSRTEKMRIDQNGNVGIGTTAPTERLSVLTTGDIGIKGETSATTGSQPRGVWGVTHSNIGRGVEGKAEASSGFTSGVFGEAVSQNGFGVRGFNNTGIGILGESGGSNGYGVQGIALGVGVTTLRAGIYSQASTQTGSWAGYFSGNVTVTGNLSKGGGSFKIDHPLDPENKYLYHSFVESPDMMNIYNGVNALNEYGQATVTMPEWFEALNQEFRYQLTSIGIPWPNLYIFSEMSGNSFKIAGGMPGAKVSWQVTGIRNDAYARKHRIPTEELKSEMERGTYLHPDAFDQPEEKGVHYKLNVARKSLMAKPKTENQ